MSKRTRRLPAAAALAALALGAFAAPAAAQDEGDAAALTNPDKAVASAGVAGVTGDAKDRALFGQYNGLREDNSYLLLDLDYVHRDNATGTWTRFRGRNLGLDTREADALWWKQGDWKFSADYSELVHREIRTINTGLLGAGTTTPTVVRLPLAGTGEDLGLEMKRQRLGLAGEKWINRQLQFQVDFRNEDKDGSRLWGRGYDCASYVCAGATTTQTRWAVLMLPEPVHSNIKQLDAKFNWHNEKALVTLGYYGSFYTNDYGSLRPTVPGSLNGPTGTLMTLSPAAGGGTSLQDVLQLPMALPPDNQAHQVYVSGNYRFTPQTVSTYKLAYTHATQDESFTGMGLTPPAGISDLGGVLDTTFAQLGLTARPLPKVSLLANLRYEDRKDKTPIETYNIENAETWPNSHISETRTNGKVEAGYEVTTRTRATLGVDYEQVKREIPPVDVIVAGLTALRARTEETGYYGELRRTFGESLIGAVKVEHSKRTGSDWYNLCTNTACTNAGLVYGGTYSSSAIYQRTGIFPYMLTDRTRDKVRLSADWNPIERLSLNLAGEHAKDDYSAPSEKGLNNTGSDLLSLDAAFALSERWKLTAYASASEQKMNVAHSTGYIADIADRTYALGFGTTGRLTSLLEVGGNLTYLDDRTKYDLGADSAANANNVAQAAIGLPDVVYKETRINLYGQYALSKKSNVRLDLVHFRGELDEWAWQGIGVPFTYSDNTTVGIQPKQQVTFVGVSYIYSFR